MSFLGRNSEINQLLSYYNSDFFESIVIFGRRRIGKSAVIKESFKHITDIPYLYYEAIEANEKSNVEKFTDFLKALLNEEVPHFDNFKSLLNYVFSLSTKEKLIIAIDEYPRLAKSVKGIDSILSNIIDEYQNDSKLKLILCGSEIDIMKSLFSENNPLFGRTNRKLAIKQMDYLDSALFYPNYSNIDKVRIFSVFGGVPYYNQYIDDSKSVEENIISLICSENARLLPEVEMRLKIEIGKLENCNEVLFALAKNKHKFSDILNESHVSSSPTLSDSLDKLKSLEIISIVHPINESEQSKKTNYYIGDPLIAFYYKYIYWNYSSFQVMDGDDFFKTFIEKEWNEHDAPKCYEKIVKQYLIRNNKEKKITPVLQKIGTYYFNNIKNRTNGEIDVVTYDEIGYTFYEVKFTKQPISMDVINLKIKQLEDCELSYYKLGFVSSNGFKSIDADDGYILLNIDDIYKNC